MKTKQKPPPLDRLRAIVAAAGYSQADVGRWLGISQGGACSLLAGKYRPGLDTAFKLEDVTNGKIKAREWVR